MYYMSPLKYVFIKIIPLNLSISTKLKKMQNHDLKFLLMGWEVGGFDVEGIVARETQHVLATGVPCNTVRITLL